MLKFDIPLEWTSKSQTPVLRRVLRENDNLTLDDIQEMSWTEYQQFKVLQARAEYEHTVNRPGSTEADVFVAWHVLIYKIDFLNETSQ